MVPAFLIEHPGAGAILVDTGFDRSVATNKAENLGRLGEAIYNVRMKPEEAIPVQLRERGVDPDDVKLVVMTHLHFDHASGVSQFPGATFVIAELEWTAATSRGGAFKGFHPPHFDHDYDWRTIDWSAAYVEGHATFGRSVDLFGDGSIRLLHTPGHTPGHLSVLLRLSDRNLLLTGDATYAIRTIDENLTPIFIDDMHDYRRSMAEIRNYRDLESRRRRDLRARRGELAGGRGRLQLVPLLGAGLDHAEDLAHAAHEQALVLDLRPTPPPSAGRRRGRPVRPAS